MSAPAAQAADAATSTPVVVAKKGEKVEKKKGQDQFVKTTYVNSTPAGTLKDFGLPMADAYQPQAVESAWDSWWQAQDLYKPECDPTKEKFVIVIPPPNITGTLHLGHALTIAIEDAVVRWNRMSGKDTLWVPGTDHAGIATQVVVEKQLQRDEGKSRHDIGRDAFLAEVWKWKATSDNRINEQAARLGASVDWSRAVFTMDKERCEAVEEAFLRLHEKKLISRANRLVNWSCSLRSAISNVEVDHEELKGPTMRRVPGYDQPIEFGVIHSFVYKLTDGTGELTVATTRIETMLGDTAVAVHPDDARYTSFHGKTLVHPFIADRVVKIITDSTLVDMSFGTGAVKVTPAHDPNDYLCGVRNQLDMINVLSNDGCINEFGGVFAGKPRFQVRDEIIVELEKLGLYKGKAANPMSLGLCSRSGDVIEPVLRPQWFVDCRVMAANACEKVKSKELTILPSDQEATWFTWFGQNGENIQDWCVSRQLWWGHRIPAYHCRFAGEETVRSEDIDDDAHWFTGRNEDEAKAKAESSTGKTVIAVRQDEDVLDTWFSSGLFPFSVMGWPKNTNDLKDFFPGSLLETGADILFFWVARMVMMSLELTGQLPFKTVYLHPMVRDKEGAKMSKSSGNVIDPIDVIEGITLNDLQQGLTKGNLPAAAVAKAQEGQAKAFANGIAECGADALRFGLLAYTNMSKNNSINLDIQVVVAVRQFGNKLWQATRFALLNFDEEFKKPTDLNELEQLMKSSPSLADAWIMHRLHLAIVATDAAFKNYKMGDATTAIRNFWLYDLCDVYLELIKPTVRLSATPSAADLLARTTSLSVLHTCLDLGLRLLHPIMPFITEELYHRLPGANVVGAGGRNACGSIMVATYPAPAMTQRFCDAQLDTTMALLTDISHSARSTRASLQLTKQRLTMYIQCGTDEIYNIVRANAKDVAVMSNAAVAHAIKADESAPAGCMSSVVSPTVEIHVPLQGLVDVGAEIVKMEKGEAVVLAKVAKLLALMSGPSYAKVPAATKLKNDVQLANDRVEAGKIKVSVDNFKSVLTPDQHAQYMQDKIAVFAVDREKIVKNIAKLIAALPVEVDKRPKKSLAKVAEAEQELKDIDEAMAKLKP